MQRVLSLSLDVDLAAVNELLRRSGVRFRITEESGMQVIWAASEAEADAIKRLLADPQLEQRLQNQGRVATPASGAGLVKSLVILRGMPLTALLAAACILVAVISLLGRRLEPVSGLFYPLLPHDSVWELLRAVDSLSILFQTLGPALLHFGELHLVFNLLWLLFFGRQLERLQPPLVYAALILLLAFISNTTQYMATGYNNFGGLSGVVYGMVGYTWAIHALMPRSHVQITNGMFGVFVLALVLMEVFASSWIASAAHLGGLLAGLLLGLLAVAIYRFVLGRSVVGPGSPGNG
jgi:GlpG protein